MYAARPPTREQVMARLRDILRGDGTKQRYSRHGRPYTGSGDSVYERRKMWDICRECQREGFSKRRTRSYSPQPEESAVRRRAKLEAPAGERIPRSPHDVRRERLDRIDNPWDSETLATSTATQTALKVGAAQASSTSQQVAPVAREELYEILENQRRLEEQVSFCGRPNPRQRDKRQEENEARRRKFAAIALAAAEKDRAPERRPRRSYIPAAKGKAETDSEDSEDM